MDDRQLLERLSAAEGPGLNTFKECTVCGYVQWVSRHTKEPDGYRMEDCPPSDCPRCLYMAQRHPEIARWVEAVVVKATRAAPSSGEQMEGSNG